MWPWEHLAVGYLLFSLLIRAWRRRPPRHVEVLIVVFATQFPDLVDKPLSWVFHILPSGLSLAHSLLFALPVSVLALTVATWRTVPESGVAFLTGYLSHLFGDAIYPYLLGWEQLPPFPYLSGWEYYPRFLLWPLYSHEANVDNALFQVIGLASSFAEFLGTPRGKTYLAFEGLLMVSFLLLWLLDGHPGFPDFRRHLSDPLTD